ncbi:MAG: hypothetical protein ACJA07_003391 [Rhodococcus sp. (in: high G+C Gram-positive bacteria)]
MVGNIVQHHTPGTDDRVAPDRDAGADCHRGSEPNIFTDVDRGSTFPSFAASTMIVHRVQRRHQLHTWADPDVRTDRDGRIVHEKPIGIDERIVSETNVAAVAASKSRHNQGPFANHAEKFRENLRPNLFVVGGGSVERI